MVIIALTQPIGIVDNNVKFVGIAIILMIDVITGMNHGIHLTIRKPMWPIQFREPIILLTLRQIPLLHTVPLHYTIYLSIQLF